MSDYLVTDTELTSIADAIRTKGGTSANLSFPTEFVSAINGIPTGSEPTGTKYIYTDETDITEAFDVGGYKYCSIDYSPVRDYTLRLWLQVNANTEVTVTMTEVQTNTIVIDWGDGEQGYANTTNSHTYSQKGRYCIELKATNIASDKLFLKGLGQSSSAPNETLVAVELCTLGSYYWYPTYYASGLLQYCTNLKKVTIVNGTELPDWAFQNGTSLETVDICEGITKIGLKAFANCTSLKKITIPLTVKKITNQAFDGCTALEEIHLLPTTPPELTSINPFNGVPSNCVFYVPQASLSAYQQASYWADYASQMVGE